MGQMVKRRMGWLPDYPDLRDYTRTHRAIAQLLKKAGMPTLAGDVLPASVDLRAWCSPVCDQGRLGSCTANAGAGLVEYFEMRAFGKHIEASRLFLYKTTRNLLHLTGDDGAFIRTTMAALVLFGLPPEEYWPYVAADFNQEPPAFCYAFAQNYQALSYYRLDPPGTYGEKLLGGIKGNLAAGLPAIFGFSVYSSIGQAESTGKIPFPDAGDELLGGHAVVTVGYDDNLKIKHAVGTKKTVGALLIRNSWGMAWGDEGYGWLPYDYVLHELAEDWWTLLKNEWVDTGAFGLRTVAPSG